MLEHHSNPQESPASYLGLVVMSLSNRLAHAYKLVG